MFRTDRCNMHRWQKNRCGVDLKMCLCCTDEQEYKCIETRNIDIPLIVIDGADGLGQSDVPHSCGKTSTCDCLSTPLCLQNGGPKVILFSFLSCL